MHPNHVSDDPPAALDALRDDLEKVIEAVKDAKISAKIAQSRVSILTAKQKKLEKVYQLLSDDAPSGITKKSLESLLSKALAKGPATEEELRSRLETSLKTSNQSTSGLGLILSKLRSSYVQTDGRWALPAPASTPTPLSEEADN